MKISDKVCGVKSSVVLADMLCGLALVLICDNEYVLFVNILVFSYVYNLAHVY